MPKKTNSKMVVFRLEKELVDQLDRMGKVLSQQNNGMGPKWNRSDVVRFAIRRLIAGLEQE